MQNGSRKMTDKRYLDIYKATNSYKKKYGSHVWAKEQLPAETCKEYPADRKAEYGKPAPHGKM